MSQVKVEVEVGPCKLDNDGLSFLDYSYEIRLICVDMFNKRLQIKSTRTLLDFCDLESRLMKILVHDNLLSPFHNITMGISEKHLESQRQKKDDMGHQLANKLISLSMGPAEGDSRPSSPSVLMENFQHKPIFGGDREQYLKANFDDDVGQENLLFKSTELGVWMLQVLQEPNILESIDFCLFFSTEEKCYRRQSLESASIGSGCGDIAPEYSLLLPSSHIKTKTVLSKHTERLEVQRGQIVLWRFSSSKDMAFSVMLNSRSLLGAKRYPSASGDVVGSLEMTSSTAGVGNLVGNGLCELTFDNKYAKMMTPTHLKFYCRAVDPAEYVDCKRRAAEREEGEAKRAAAVNAVKDIFFPRAASLRERGSIDGAAATLTTDEDSTNEGTSAAVCSVSGGGEGTILHLQEENKALRAQNEELRKQCEQLQSKIDAVLNFANTNSGNSTSKKAFSQQEAGKSKRRQTYAVYEQQEQQQEHQHLTHPSDDISALSSMIIDDELVRAPLQQSRPKEDIPIISTTNHSEQGSGHDSTTGAAGGSVADVIRTDDAAPPSTIAESEEPTLVDDTHGSGTLIDLEMDRHHHTAEVAILQRVEQDSDDDEDSD